MMTFIISQLERVVDAQEDGSTYKPKKKKKRKQNQV